jgi:hypothetical protein
MDAVITAKFVAPWARITQKLNALHERHALDAESDGAMINRHVSRIKHLYDTLDNYYSTTRFSLQRAAEVLTQFFGWFEHEIDRATHVGDRAQIISLWGLLEAQATAMSPMLPDFSAGLLGCRVAAAPLAWQRIPTNLRPFRLVEEEKRIRRIAI